MSQVTSVQLSSVFFSNIFQSKSSQKISPKFQSKQNYFPKNVTVLRITFLLQTIFSQNLCSFCLCPIKAINKNQYIQWKKNGNIFSKRKWKVLESHLFGTRKEEPFLCKYYSSIRQKKRYIYSPFATLGQGPQSVKRDEYYLTDQVSLL